MERRDAARIENADGNPPALDPPRPPSKRFARLAATPVAKKLAVGRVGRVVVLGIIVTSLLVVGGSSVSRTLVAWLHHQPEYQLRFADIEIEPPVPPWIKGGRKALLENIQAGRKALDSFSALDIPLEQIRNAFHLNPWVSSTDRVVRTFPNKVTIFVTLREPMARVSVANKSWFIVDREGKVLPEEEVELSRLDLPVMIVLKTPPSSPPIAGLDWPGVQNTETSGSKSRVALSISLARFLRDRMSAEKGRKNVPQVASIFVDEKDYLGLMLKFDNRLHVFWGRDADRGKSSEPSDLEKWRRITARTWDQEGLTTPKFRLYLEFTRDGVVTTPFQDPG
jgi:hypothetical protein